MFVYDPRQIQTKTKVGSFKRTETIAETVAGLFKKRGGMKEETFLQVLRSSKIVPKVILATLYQ